MKTFITRSKYLLYYFYKMVWSRFWKYYSFVKETKKLSGFFIWYDAIKSVYQYNIGLIDYFYFGFYDKDAAERSTWIGTGFKYEYDLVMNPVKNRMLLLDKVQFFDLYGSFVNHTMVNVKDLKENTKDSQKVLSGTSGKVVVKDSTGQCGWDVEVKNVSELTTNSLIAEMEEKGFDIVEEFIVQHDRLKELSDSGLNTVRIITQLNAKGEVEFIGPTLRITVNSPVDNMAMGNIAAAIDIDSGMINRPGVYQDITKKPESNHPITGVPIVGFQIPYWEKVKELCITAALHDSRNRSIGWDVAITNSGPAFVEGNHNWCKILWQLPLEKGMKLVLEKHLMEYQQINL